MEIHVLLTADRLEDRPVPDFCNPGTGAWVEFRGLVRDREQDRPIAALEYEAYEPMACSEIRRILSELQAGHPCQAVQVLHRVGLIPVGEAAIIVRIAAAHRREAFALLAAFMDRLKEDVPIWKRRGWTAGELQAAGRLPGTGLSGGTSGP
jgi:molybdopterin synthase catalytic subunit